MESRSVRQARQGAESLGQGPVFRGLYYAPFLKAPVTTTGRSQVLIAGQRGGPAAGPRAGRTIRDTPSVSPVTCHVAGGRAGGARVTFISWSLVLWALEQGREAQGAPVTPKNRNQATSPTAQPLGRAQVLPPEPHLRALGRLEQGPCGAPAVLRVSCAPTRRPRGVLQAHGCVWGSRRPDGGRHDHPREDTELGVCSRPQDWNPGSRVSPGGGELRGRVPRCSGAGGPALVPV